MILITPQDSSCLLLLFKMKATIFSINQLQLLPVTKSALGVGSFLKWFPSMGTVMQSNLNPINFFKLLRKAWVGSELEKTTVIMEISHREIWYWLCLVFSFCTKQSPPIINLEWWPHAPIPDREDIRHFQAVVCCQVATHIIERTIATQFSSYSLVVSIFLRNSKTFCLWVSAIQLSCNNHLHG